MQSASRVCEAPDKAPGAFVEASCAPWRIMVGMWSPAAPPHLANAACRRPGVNSEDFFPGRGQGKNRSAMRRALAVCDGCVDREECLNYALGEPWLLGVWGGTSHRQRLLLRRSMQVR
jgi:Transcription factor WhiB